jgi:class 3 adenylate cyclase/tetratricopeptide (TPR) repeat protein
MSDLRGEERLVTVVFSDMTESVRRTSGLSAEEATVLVNPLLETMVELMVKYGGRIDRFLGDGVLAVFGVPTAHEDDPFRAVRAALELRDRAVELGLAVTSGVNTGRVYFGPVGSSLHEELTVMGPTVNLAARFQGAATAGEIMVGASTASHLAAAFALDPVTLQIKGMSEPVEAFKAERLLDNPEKVRGIEGLRAELIGRDAELDRLRSAFPAGPTLALVGPAGVGKSRLAAEFRSHVIGAGGSWMEGRCLQLTEGTSYGPFLDLFARHLGTADRLDGLRSSLTGLVESGVVSTDRADEIAPFLAHLLGSSLGDHRDLRVVESSAELRKTLTIDALVEYLGACSRLSPLVVFLEDVHWSDPLSREAISRLGATAGDSLMLLVAYRPMEDGDRAEMLGPDGVELTLTELSRTDSRRLISMLLDISGIPEWLEAQILDHGQGNPFYVEELIRSLIQKGAITRADGRWSITTEDIELDLPESVEGVLMSRFDRLGDTTRRAAKAASVLDRTFSQPLFTELAGSQLVRELDTLVGAGILRSEPANPSPRFSFLHALTRQAIYTNLLPSQRAELHERTAQALERSPAPDIDQIAFHYQHSRNHPKAVEHLLKAGERALASFTTDSARAHLERGLGRIDELAESDRPRWRSRYHARRGELLERMAQHEAARADLEAALTGMEPDPVEEARIWNLNGRTHRLDDDFDAAHRCYDRAEAILAAIGDPEDTAGRQGWIQVQKERAFALYFGGRGRELPAHNERVAPVVERFGSAAQQADHLYGQVLSSYVDVRFVVPAATVEKARRALDLAEAGADPGRVAEGRFVLGFSLLWGDQLEEAATMLGRAVEETTRVGAVTEGCRARAYRAIALRRLGRVDEAEAAAEEALQAAREIGSDYYAGHALAVSCWVAWKRGEDSCDRLGEQAYEAWGRLERGEDTGLECEFAWLGVWPRAAAALARGDTAAAASHLRLLLVPWERPLPEDLRAVVEKATIAADPTLLAEAVRLAETHAFL